MSSDLALCHVGHFTVKSHFFLFRRRRIMLQGNQTISEFFLLGLTAVSEQQQHIFVLFLCMVWLPWWEIYLISWLLSAMPTSTVPCTSSSLPIYPSPTSASHLLQSPKCWQTSKARAQSSPLQDALHKCTFMLLVDLEQFPLGSHGDDRYIAICHPLHYAALLSLKRCALLVVTPWVVCNLVSVLHLTAGPLEFL